MVVRDLIEKLKLENPLAEVTIGYGDSGRGPMTSGVFFLAHEKITENVVICDRYAK